MKTINISINLYSFNELKGDAEQLAINEQWEFLCEVSESEEEYNSVDLDYVIDSILLNKYWYDINGKMLHTLTYTGKQPKTGNTYFIHDKKEYLI